jgi:hypothetical protein
MRPGPGLIAKITFVAPSPYCLLAHRPAPGGKTSAGCPCRPAHPCIGFRRQLVVRDSAAPLLRHHPRISIRPRFAPRQPCGRSPNARCRFLRRKVVVSGCSSGVPFAPATATWEPTRMVWSASARRGRRVRRHGSSRTRSFGWLPSAARPCEGTRHSARCLAAPSAGHTPPRPAAQRRLACRLMTASHSSPSLPPCPLSALRYAIAPGCPGARRPAASR